MSTRGREEQPEVVRISSARQSHSDDLDARVRRYLISMAIRTVCVVLAVVVEGPFRWVFVAGAVGLPYLAVVMANAGGTRREAPVARPTFERTALPPASAAVEPPVSTTIIRDPDVESREPAGDPGPESRAS